MGSDARFTISFPAGPRRLVTCEFVDTGRFLAIRTARPFVEGGSCRNRPRGTLAGQQIKDNVDDIRRGDPPTPSNLVNAGPDLRQHLAIHFVFCDIRRTSGTLWNPMLFTKLFHQLGIAFRVSPDLGLFRLLRFARQGVPNVRMDIARPAAVFARVKPIIFVLGTTASWRDRETSNVREPAGRGVGGRLPWWDRPPSVPGSGWRPIRRRRDVR